MRTSPSRLTPLLLLIASCQTAGSNTAASLQEDAAARKAELDVMVAEADIPNIILGYVTRDGTTEFLSYGSLSSEDPTPVDEDTPYMIASMTKAVTATAAAGANAAPASYCASPLVAVCVIAVAAVASAASSSTVVTTRF